MRAAGGPLDAIAAPFSAALRDPNADWAAVQAGLRQTIADIHLVAKVGDQGTISGLRQRVENPAGTYEGWSAGSSASSLSSGSRISAVRVS